MYLVDDVLHDSLVARNPTIRFEIRNTASSLLVDLPYSVLDFMVEQPYVNTSSAVFPLRRGVNDSMIALGRVFLQQVYLTANYDTHELSVSRAMYNASAETRIFTITNSTASARDTTLSTGGIAGIVLGTFITIVSILMLSWVCTRRQRSGKNKFMQKMQDEIMLKPEIDGRERLPIEADALENAKHELEVVEGGEVEGSPAPSVELPGIIPRYELHDRRSPTSS